MMKMNKHKRKASLLIEVLTWLIVIGITLSTGFAIVSRSLAVQYRSSDWLAEDAQLKHLLRRLHQDVVAAGEAEIDEAPMPTLILRRPDGQVRYLQRDGAIVRLKNHESGGSVERVWNLNRCSLKWTIEQPPGGAALVWTGVTQAVRPEEGRNHLVYRYAAAVRVGSKSAEENLP